MYLSRVFLNPLRRETRNWMSSPQRLHAAVLGGFPAQANSVEGRVLWRVDEDDHRVELYVVSVEQPDLMHLVEAGGWETSRPDVGNYDLFLGQIAVGRRYVFRLRGNTVRSTKGGVAPGGRGRVVNVGSRAEQESWLLGRAGSSGFTIPDDPLDILDASGQVLTRRNLALTRRETLRFTRRTDGTSRHVTLSTAQFDGVLEVTDPELLRSALCMGIGRGRAYGCGLMTLAPV